MKPLGTICLLDADPSLRETMEPAERKSAQNSLSVEAFAVPVGRCRPRSLFGDIADDLGLLLIDGLLIREVLVAHTTCGELVGPGELLRPWDTARDEYAPLPFEIEWKVLRPLRVARLSPDFTEVASRWPALLHELMERAVGRSNSLALHVAIHCIRRVDLSLLVLFWHLADRFGRVTPEGIVIRLKLTHEDLGTLVGASRQSVTVALGEAESRGWVTRRRGGTWVLPAEPPPEIAVMLRRRDAANPGPVPVPVPALSDL